MKNICIIPARGGSKRIPRKNIKEFLGKPIIGYSIDTALKSKLFDEVIVSTDDQEIANLAVSYGAKVPFLRSKKNSNDNATIFDAIQEVLLFYKKIELNPEIISCIFPTAPFINFGIIKKGFSKVLENDFDSAFTIQKFNYPIFRALHENKKGNLQMFWKKYLNTRKING